VSEVGHDSFIAGGNGRIELAYRAIAELWARTQKSQQGYPKRWGYDNERK